MNDETNPNGHIRPIAPAEAIDDVPPDSARFDTAAALLRLLVGGALVGMDELRIHLERWQEAAQAPAQTVHQTTRTAQTILTPPPRTTSDALRYTLVGMLFETETRMRRGFASMAARFSRFSRSLVRPTSSIQRSDPTGIGRHSIRCGCVWTTCASGRWRPLTGGLTVDGWRNNRAAAWRGKP